MKLKSFRQLEKIIMLNKHIEIEKIQWLQQSVRFLDDYSISFDEKHEVWENGIVNRDLTEMLEKLAQINCHRNCLIEQFNEYQICKSKK